MEEVFLISQLKNDIGTYENDIGIYPKIWKWSRRWLHSCLLDYNYFKKTLKNDNSRFK